MKEKVEKTIKTIIDFKELIEDQDGLPISSLAEILARKDMQYINTALSIIQKYREPSAIFEIEPTILQDDMTRLGAINVNQAMVTGYLVGIAKHSEEDLKLAKSKVQSKTKAMKQEFEKNGEIVKITEKDVDSLTRIKTQELTLRKINESGISEAAKHFYYAVQSFIDVLRSNYVRVYEES